MFMNMTCEYVWGEHIPVKDKINYWKLEAGNYLTYSRTSERRRKKKNQ